MDVNYRTDGNKVWFQGNFNNAEIKVKLEEVLSKLDLSKDIEIDLSDVFTSNSTGMIEYFNFVKQIETNITYNKAPVWLLEQFNMLRGLYTSKTKVISILLPFTDSETDKEIIKEYTFGDNLPDLEDYEDFDLDEIEVDGKIYEGTFDLPTLLTFKSMKF